MELGSGVKFAIPFTSGNCEPGRAFSYMLKSFPGATPQSVFGAQLKAITYSSPTRLQVRTAKESLTQLGVAPPRAGVFSKVNSKLVRFSVGEMFCPLAQPV
jgi:hypothetical protein